ncbi:MAG: ABC transporter ATP-binding protein [Ardenticatenales bacterium]|nr:ABC transporter ATP-binding protein [Ardenticatenales bacterium]
MNPTTPAQPLTSPPPPHRTTSSAPRTPHERTPPTARRLIRHYLRPHHARIAVLAVLLLGHIGLQLGIPQFIRAFIDRTVAGAPPSALVGIAVAFLGAAVVNELLSAAVTWMGQDVRWRATNALRADLTRHALRLDLTFHGAQTPGKMIERLDGDVTELSNLMSDYALRAAGNVLTLVGVLVLLAREDGWLGLAFLGFVLAVGATFRPIARVAVPAWAVSREANSEFIGFIEERLHGTEDIRAAGAVGWTMAQLQHATGRMMRVERRASLLGSSLWMATVILFTAAHALALGFGAHLYVSGAITIGTVYLIFHYTEMLRHPFEMLVEQLQDLQRAAGSLKRVTELLGTPSRETDVDAPQRLPATRALGVRCEAVGFHYPDGAAVLQDVSFDLPPGRVLGLLGRTGSGKSTLARLLMRLYDPTSGVIRLGEVDTRAAALAEVRARVAFVTQDVQLFSATVRDNLTLFDPSVPDARVTDVIASLGLGGWLEALPDGLDTELQTGGGGLSAGEAQLLAFARAFLKDPGLVILDEASARLDPATEQRIEVAVDRLLHGRTGIVIAHRLGTVHRADDILILEDGRVREYGDRVALVADPASRFRALLATGLEEVLA